MPNIIIWNDDYLKKFNWCFKILFQRLELFVSPTRFTSKERIEWIWYFNRVVKIIFWLWRTLTKHALCALFLHCVVSSFYTVGCCLYFSKVTIYVSDQKLWTLKRATRHLVGEQLGIPKQFGNIVCQVFKERIQNFIDFWQKINLVQGNYWILWK